jgi:glycosyltransferase involved in cell wall biosynthesis
MTGEALAKAVGRRVSVKYGGYSVSPPSFWDTTIGVTGFHVRRTGISRGAELQARAFRRLQLDVRLLDASPCLRNPVLRSGNSTRLGALVMHAGGPQLAQSLAYFAPGRSTYRIGYVAWELTQPPVHWRGYDAGVDEIWTPSHYSAETLRATSNKPVHVVRHVSAMPPAVPRGIFRARLGLAADTFVALTFADLRSSLARKNPAGAIQAFRSAFHDRQDVCLIVKLTAADRGNGLVDQLRQIAGSANVKFVCEHFSDIELWSLLSDADVLISMHRAEGFGIPILEAMSAGCAVLATNWSGNADFMSNETAVPLPYKLVPVSDPQGIYRTGVWAEPDMDATIDWLRRLEADRAQCRALGMAAADDASLERQQLKFKADLPEYVLNQHVS